MPMLRPADDQELLQNAAILPGPDIIGPPEILPDRPASTGQSPSALGHFLARASHLLGLDAAIVFTVLARGWSSIAGLVTLALIAHFLSPAEQGYYYTFYPLVNLQIIFELGFSVVILQTASHEAAHLTLHPDGSIAGPRVHVARLASTLAKAVRWYSAAALILLAILVPAGIAFFSRHTTPGQTVHWLGPWILAVVATTFTFQIDPIFSFLEGCGYVPEVARARLAQAITGSLLGWLALRTHHGLFAPGCMIGGQAIAGSLFLLTRRRLLLGLKRMQVEPQERVSWRTDIWPFQWRMAISWVCGYFTFQLFTPVLFAHAGAVEAGRMGMSLNIAGALSTIAIAWMNTKAGPFGKLIARRQFAELDQSFRRALTQSTAINLLGAGVIFIGSLILAAHHVPLAARLLAPLPFAMLLAGSIGNNIVAAEAMYLRAHKQERFMINSIVGALYTAPMVYLLGTRFGSLGIASGYLAGTIVIGLGFGTYTFLRWRRIWHG